MIIVVSVPVPKCGQSQTHSLGQECRSEHTDKHVDRCIYAKGVQADPLQAYCFSDM